MNGATMSVRIAARVTFVAAAAVSVFACSQSEPEVAYAQSARASTPATTGVQSDAAKRAALKLVLAPTGNEARYRVREQLMSHDLPNDAVGETKNLTGWISFDSNGKVIRDASKFTVDASSFVSDQDRRDGYVRRRLLESDSYPRVILVPTEITGVKLPLPTSGSAPITMKADLTVRGVTHPTTWTGTASFANGGVSGKAATAFTFDDIQLDQPRVPVLLSVADTIKLEIDFNLVQQR